MPPKNPKKKEATPEEATTAAKILGLLRERHSDQEWVFFEELATSGTDDHRYMDGFAMHLWRSKKWRRICYEIKVSRADLMGELQREPEKRAAAMKVCNQFFYVVPTGLFDAHELPEKCGLIEAHKSGLRVKVAAKYREVPDPSFAFVARMLQRMQGYERPPVPCFKYAGRDMSEEEFREFVQASMPAETEVLLDKKVRDGIERWKKDNEVVAAIEYLKKESGHTWSGLDFNDLKEWIEGIRTGIPIKDLKWVASQMKDVRDALSRILERVPTDDEEEETDGDGGDEGETNPVQRSDGAGDPGGKENPDPPGDQPATPSP